MKKEKTIYICIYICVFALIFVDFLPVFLRAHSIEQISFSTVFPPSTHLSAELTEAMPIKCLAHGHNNNTTVALKHQPPYAEVEILSTRSIFQLHICVSMYIHIYIYTYIYIYIIYIYIYNSKSLDVVQSLYFGSKMPSS